MNTIIREAKPEDFDAIFALFGQLWPGKELHHGPLREVFLRGIAGQTDRYFCAQADGSIVGFCAMAIVNNFWQEGQIAYLYAMIVDAALRGQGVGTRLLEQASDAARMLGCKRLELDSGFPREKAHAFYENVGFIKRAYLFSKEL